MSAPVSVAPWRADALSGIDHGSERGGCLRTAASPLIAEGKTNKEIAILLAVSVPTVKTHRRHISAKLDLHNTAGLVRFAVRKKVVY